MYVFSWFWLLERKSRNQNEMKQQEARIIELETKKKIVIFGIEEIENEDDLTMKNRTQPGKK